jgi:hypothetical protein
VRRLAAALVGLGLSWGAPALEPVPLPASAAREVADAAPRGSHRFRFLAFHVYDATLWTRGGAASLEAPHALDIRYAMDIAGRDLTRRSIEEMRKQGVDDEALLARWEREMARVFPDIRPGDRLVGVHVPGVEARFHSQRGALGTVRDAAFARAFFDIWLGERTSEPGMRRRLLALEAK